MIINSEIIEEKWIKILKLTIILDSCTTVGQELVWEFDSF